MFQYCRECYQVFVNAPSWLTPMAQIASAIVAAIALYVAWRSLGGVKRSHTLQAQMNLISLENEIRKNFIQYKIVLDDYSKARLQDTDIMSNKMINAFEIYVTSADKIAALISSDYLFEQFPHRDWQLEYEENFKKVKIYHQGENSIITGKGQMIRNIDKLLSKSKWN